MAKSNEFLLSAPESAGSFAEAVCPMCGSKGARLVMQRINNSNIVKCNHCSLHYMYPMYSGAQLEEFYKNTDYFEVYGGGANTFLDYNEKAKTNPRSHFYYRLNRILKYAKGKDLLEIGSSFGDFLDFASNVFKLNVKGHELNASARKLSRERFPGIHIYSEYIQDIHDGAKFDIICFFAVLEHVDDPHSFIEGIKSKLKEDGIVYISVPNGRTYYYLRKRWADYSQSLEHLVFYSPKTLAELMKMHGFETESITTVKFDLNTYPLHYKIIHTVLSMFGAGKELEGVFRLKKQ